MLALALGAAATTQAQTTSVATPTFSLSTVGTTALVTIQDATPGATIYYATGGRTPTTGSLKYTGPLTVSLPITISAIAAATGYSNSAIGSAAFSASSLATTTITTSSSPSLLGQAVTFTAVVSGPSGNVVPPTGTVQFTVNGTALGSPVTTYANGAYAFAQYTTSLLPEAEVKIVAAYTPAVDSTLVPSTSLPLTQDIYSSQHQSQVVWFNNSAKPLGSGFSRPYGLAIDGNDNVFVADTGNGAVKEIVAAGGYTTINVLGAGLGYGSPTAIAIDNTGNLFVADSTYDAVYEIPAAGGYSGTTPVGGGLDSPYGVAVDTRDNVFVTDLGHSAVKEISPSVGGGYGSPTIVSTISQPWGVAVDSLGNLFVTDLATRSVKEIAAASGYTNVSTIGSNFIYIPYGLAVDPNDNLFINDIGLDAVREISLIDDWTTVSTPESGLNNPIGVAVDSAGNLFVADTTNNVVKEISWAGGGFGSVKFGSTSPLTVSMYFLFDGPVTLGSTAVLTNASGPSQFTDAGTGTCYPQTPYTASASCTIDVNFTPTQLGTITGSVELLDGSGKVLALGTVQGTGVAQ